MMSHFDHTSNHSNHHIAVAATTAIIKPNFLIPMPMPNPCLYVRMCPDRTSPYFLAPSALQLQPLLELLALVFVLFHLLLGLAHLLFQAIQEGAALDSSRHFYMWFVVVRGAAQTNSEDSLSLPSDSLRIDPDHTIDQLIELDRGHALLITGHTTNRLNRGWVELGATFPQ